jgi:hypothetical protein
MGVPDSFTLPTGYNAAYKAMGDGVAVPAVAWLSKHLLSPIATKCREENAYDKSTTSCRSAKKAYGSVAEEFVNEWNSNRTNNATVR